MIPCAQKSAANVAFCVAFAVALIGFSVASFLWPRWTNEWILFAVHFSLNVRLLLKYTRAPEKWAPASNLEALLSEKSSTRSPNFGPVAKWDFASWRHAAKSAAHVSAYAGVLAAVVATSAEPAAARAWPFVLAFAVIAETA